MKVLEEQRVLKENIFDGNEIFPSGKLSPEIPKFEIPSQSSNVFLKVLSRCFSMVRYDTMTLVYIAVFMINSFILRYQSVSNPYDLKAFFTDFAICSLLACSAFFVHKGRRAIFYIATLFAFTIILVGDALYIRSHNSLLSFFLIPQTAFLAQVSDSWMSLFRLIDGLLVLNLVLFTCVTIQSWRKGDFSVAKEKGCVRRKLGTCILTSLIIITVIGINLSKAEASRLSKHWNRHFLVERFGAYAYHLSDAIKYASSIHGLTDILEDERQEVVDFFAERNAKPAPVNEYTNLLAGQNIIVIHAESVQNLFFFKKINGVEITPNLNRIARESLYFEHFYTQQSSGTSSDTEFTFNTSLFPIESGTVFISHFAHNFVTLPMLLKEKGYTAISMHANNGDFWNRDTMHKTLGYDHFYSKKDYLIDEEIGMGLSDVSFFKQSIDYLKRTPQPYYATLITLTNHTPFEQVDKYGPFDSGNLEGTRTGNYFKSLRYSDEAIGKFFDELRRNGMDDNTTVVIYGDHPARLARDEIAQFLGMKKLSSYDQRRYETVPFIIWSKNIREPKTIHKPMGTIDTFPTLANMFELRNPFALGVDIFSVESNQVFFPNGNWIDEDIYYKAATMKYKVFNEDFISKYRIRRTEAQLETDSRGDVEDLGKFDEAVSRLDPDLIELSRTRVLQFVRGKRHKLSLGRGTHEHVYEQNMASTKFLEISERILDYNLLRPGEDGTILGIAPESFGYTFRDTVPEI
jgi:lipoteichoic acid synthase